MGRRGRWDGSAEPPRGVLRWADTGRGHASAPERGPLRTAEGPPGVLGLLVRVGGRRRGDEGLLHRTRAGPTRQVLRRTGLVVGAGGPGTAEGLLTDDGTGGPVVDVEVAGREAQRLLGLGHGLAVAGDDGTGQGVGRTLVDGLEDLPYFASSKTCTAKIGPKYSVLKTSLDGSYTYMFYGGD